jgi:hypothetical protein
MSFPGGYVPKVPKALFSLPPFTHTHPFLMLLCARIRNTISPSLSTLEWTPSCISFTVLLNVSLCARICNTRWEGRWHRPSRNGNPPLPSSNANHEALSSSPGAPLSLTPLRRAIFLRLVLRVLSLSLSLSLCVCVCVYVCVCVCAPLTPRTVEPLLRGLPPNFVPRCSRHPPLQRIFIFLKVHCEPPRGGGQRF